MANYVTIPANPNENVNTDLKMLMPYLQGELNRIRDKDKIKLDTLATLQHEARTNPDEFRGTDFQIGADGYMEMNDKAAQMGRVDRDEDRSVAAINDTKKTIDRELTANIGKDAIAELQNTPAYQSAVQASQELGKIDVTKLVTKAMNNQNADGDSMLKNVPDLNSSTPATDAIGNQITNDKGIARTTETDQREEGAVATPNYVSADSVNPIPTADPLLRYSGSEPKEVATPVQDNVLKTGTNAEKTVAMAKAFPGMGAKNKTDDTKAESAGSKTSKAANYTITMDRGVGSSTMDVDPVYHTITKTQQGITDTDNSNLKQLRRASALERIVSTSMGGTPQAPKLNTIADRLAEREAFVNKAESAKNSLVTSDTYEGGKTKAVLGEVKASSTVKSGVDSMNSVTVNNKTISGNVSQVDNTGKGDTNKDTDAAAMVSIGSRKMVSKDTGRRTKGNEAIFEFNTPTDYDEGYTGSNVGNKLANSPGKNWKEKNANFIKAMKLEQGMDAKYNSATEAWEFSNGDGETAILHKNGSVTGVMTAGTAQAMFGNSSRKSAAHDAMDALEDENGPNGRKKTSKVKK